MPKSKRFIAEYSGKCASCLEPIRPGDTVAYSRIEEKQLVCEGCADMEDNDET